MCQWFATTLICIPRANSFSVVIRFFLGLTQPLCLNASQLLCVIWLILLSPTPFLLHRESEVECSVSCACPTGLHGQSQFFQKEWPSGVFERNCIAPITTTVSTVSESRLPHLMSNGHERKEEEAVVLNCTNLLFKMLNINSQMHHVHMYHQSKSQNSK